MLRRMTASALYELLLEGEYEVIEGYAEQDLLLLLRTGVMDPDHPFDVEFP